MLKKVSAVALSASILTVSNCAFQTIKATGEEKATVATTAQTKEQNQVVEFFKKHGLKVGIGAVAIIGTVAGPIVVYYTFLRNHLQAEINDLVKLAKKNVTEDKQDKHKKALQAKAKKVLEVAEWVIIASKDNKANKEEVAKAIKALFTTKEESNEVFGNKVGLDKVENKATAKQFLTKMGEVFGGLSNEKTNSKEAYRVRKNRGFFMQYKDANEVAKMFTDATTAIGA